MGAGRVGQVGDGRWGPGPPWALNLAGLQLQPLKPGALAPIHFLLARKQGTMAGTGASTGSGPGNRKAPQQAERVGWPTLGPALSSLRGGSCCALSSHLYGGSSITSLGLRGQTPCRGPSWSAVLHPDLPAPSLLFPKNRPQAGPGAAQALEFCPGPPCLGQAPCDKPHIPSSSRQFLCSLKVTSPGKASTNITDL